MHVSLRIDDDEWLRDLMEINGDLGMNGERYRMVRNVEIGDHDEWLRMKVERCDEC